MEIAKTGDIYIPGSPEFLQKAVKSGVVDAKTGSVRKLAYLVPAMEIIRSAVILI